jgi:hypothetical protein
VTLNWVFRKLKEPFLRIYPDPELAELKLNEHYFAEAAKSLNVDLRKFIKPNFSQSVKAGPKTLNKNYVYAISKSNEFMRDLAVALERDFESEMRNAITKQICAMVDKWEAQLAKSTNRAQALAVIQDYVLKTAKLKLSWTITEIMNARDRTVETLSSHQ